MRSESEGEKVSSALIIPRLSQSCALSHNIGKHRPILIDRMICQYYLKKQSIVPPDLDQQPLTRRPVLV